MLTRTRVRNRRNRRNREGPGAPGNSRARKTNEPLDQYVQKHVGSEGFNKDGSIKARVLWKISLDKGNVSKEVQIQARHMLDARGLDRIPERFSPEYIIEPEQLVELQRIHMQRSLQAQLVDEGMKAQIADSVEEWIREPNRRDIVGVDYPGDNSPRVPTLVQLGELAIENIPDKPRTQSDGKQPKKQWLPGPLENELREEFNRPEDQKTGVALVKYFTPDGSATWYISEYMPEDDVFYGYCDLGNGYPEIGYVSRKELRETQGNMGLHIERDYYFTPKTLNEIQGKPTIPQGYESLAEMKRNK
jgi:hypothetical protein